MYQTSLSGLILLIELSVHATNNTTKKFFNKPFILCRYQAVCNSLLYSEKSLKHAKRKCSLAWLTGLVLALPVLTAEIDSNSCQFLMEKVPWLVAYLPVVCFILPLILITGIYIIIFFKMAQREKSKDKTKHVSYAL